jgi:hypothetical protein
MEQDLRFALLFNYADGPLAALNALKLRLPEAQQVRWTLVFKGNVLKFEKNPLADEGEEFGLQLSAFPLGETSAERQRAVFQEVYEAFAAIVGKLEILAEDDLL